MIIPDLSSALTITSESAAAAVRLAVCSFPGRQAWLEQMRIPFRLCADGLIAAYPRFFQEEGIGGTCTFPVSRDILEGLSLSTDDIFAAAEKNTSEAGFLINSLEEMVGAETALPSAGTSVWCVRENRPVYGASVILDHTKLRKIHHLLGSSFFIIPSSVHELLVLRESEGDRDSLNRIIREVNAAEVSPEERLADRVFLFDGKDLVVP